MPWKRILVGVDDSPQAVTAAALGAHLAEAMGGECLLVHAVREFWLAFAEEEIVERSAELRAALVDSARRQIATAVRGEVPEDTIRSMIVRAGSPAAVLRDVARELGADVVILGGKHHATLRRWAGGRTAHNTVRSVGLPVLVTGPRAAGGGVLFRRILAAVDLSEAALPTAAAACDLATALRAELRALSVIETPLPLPDVTPALTPSEYSGLAERTLVKRVWPLFRGPSVQTIALPGRVMDTIQHETSQWGADLLVVGSHGKGWGERLILGSVTEQLLTDLPTSLLVVPVNAQPKVRKRVSVRKRAHARAGK
jgi:nucleotide-binding universal stress UspA family protein